MHLLVSLSFDINYILDPAFCVLFGVLLDFCLLFVGLLACLVTADDCDYMKKYDTLSSHRCPFMTYST